MTNPEEPIKHSDWTPVYRGKLFEILQNDKGWEKASRAPGVRLILDDEAAKKVLLTREFRSELNSYDFRLPGGKVFDSLEEYDAFRGTGVDIVEPATAKVVQETHEETGYDIVNPKFLGKSTLGATVDWDLYVFAATNFVKRSDGQALEIGEQIETDLWFGYDEARRMILDGSIHEERIALALLRYLEDNHGTH